MTHVEFRVKKVNIKSGRNIRPDTKNDKIVFIYKVEDFKVTFQQNNIATLLILKQTCFLYVYIHK